MTLQARRLVIRIRSEIGTVIAAAICRRPGSAAYCCERWAGSRPGRRASRTVADLTEHGGARSETTSLFRKWQTYWPDARPRPFRCRFSAAPAPSSQAGWAGARRRGTAATGDRDRRNRESATSRAAGGGAMRPLETTFAAISATAQERLVRAGLSPHSLLAPLPLVCLAEPGSPLVFSGLLGAALPRRF